MVIPRTVAGAVAALLLVVLAALSLVAAPAGAQGPSASSGSLNLSTAQVDAGDWITVRGEGFPAGALLLVEVCGTSTPPELGCDGSIAVDGEVDRNGSFEVPLHVDAPPTSCPCTIRATNDDLDVAASTPITIAGASTTPGQELTGSTGGAALVADVAVTGVSLTGDDSWTTWFGASPQRTFRYTIRNSGTGPAEGLRVEIRGGHGGERHVLRAPPVGTIDPGGSRSFAVPVDLGPFAVGEYRVVAVLAGNDGADGRPERQAFGATTSSFPWMLVVIPAIVLFEVVLLVTRNRMRDRVQGRAAVATVAPAVATSVVARVERTRAVGVDTGIVAERAVRRVSDGTDAAEPSVVEPDGSDDGPEPLPVRLPKRATIEEPVSS